MKASWLRLAILAGLSLLVGGTALHAMTAEDRLLVNANSDRDNWRLHGRTYDNQRFSPLTQINRLHGRAAALIRTLHTGVNNSFEDTPIEVDGVLYTVAGTNHVAAWDAVSGQQLWAWQPDKLDYTEACCGPQARGVAVAYGKVYTALFDGHLVALDARTGKLIWEDRSGQDPSRTREYYTYTQAPQVYDGMVIIGTAGAEYETRGMVEAYDARPATRSGIPHHRRARRARRRYLAWRCLEIRRRFGVEHAHGGCRRTA